MGVRKNDEVEFRDEKQKQSGEIDRSLFALVSDPPLSDKLKDGVFIGSVRIGDGACRGDRD